jgi:drug/metabolite transporter (DMT)-like permease
VPTHGVGVTLGLTAVVVGDRSLGHQRAQACIISGVGKVRELLGTDMELVTQLPQMLGNLAEAPLDRRLRHAGDCRWRRRGRPTGTEYPDVTAPIRWLTARMRRLFTLAFIWGWSFLLIKVAVAGITPSAVAWTRIALGALVLRIVLSRLGGRVPLDPVSLRHFAVAAVMGNIVPFTLLAWGEQHISSALTAVLNASTPLFTAVFAAIGLHERLRPVQIAGLVVGIVGVAVAAGVGASDLHGSSAAGAAAAVLAGVGYGMAFVYMRRHLVSYQPIVAATGQLLAGAVLLAPVAVLTSVAGGVSLTPTRVAAMVLLGAVGTGIAYVLNYRIIADLGATKASLVTYLIPVVAVIVGVLVLGEAFEWRLLIGGALTVTGIAAVNRRQRVVAALR